MQNKRSIYKNKFYFHILTIKNYNIKFFKYHLQSHQTMKYLDLSLTKYVQDIYAESYRKLTMKEIKEDLNNGEICHMYRWMLQYY